MIQFGILPSPPFSRFRLLVMAIVAQPWVACHQMSGMVKQAAMAAPARNQRLRTKRHPPLRSAPTKKATAKNPTLCLLARPRPSTRPAVSHRRRSPVRPIRTTTSAKVAQARMSNVVGPIRWPAPRTAGMVAVPIAATSWARGPPPSSRASSPPTTTVPATASAGHRRRPGSETPKSDSDTRARSGVRIGWST